MTTKRQVSSGEQQDSPPPAKHRWQAHGKSVISLQVIDYFKQGQYILSASTDCTAKLWTLEGVVVGMFGQVGECENICLPFPN